MTEREGEKKYVVSNKPFYASLLLRYDATRIKVVSKPNGLSESKLESVKIMF